ncbi:MAG: diadenylate cyclase CdaA [Deltaproteobacteria bacterium]|nr:diadenylate cyclase CdaA [Deltaproteobacteria bacterium]
MNQLELFWRALWHQSALRIVLDLLDIGLIAFVFYRVFLLIRGTRALQVAIGLGLLLLAREGARRLGLHTFFTLLDAVLTYIVVLAIVLFQNDIRRALMRVAVNPFTSRRKREEQMIEEVVQGAKALAKQGIGALIVFERDALIDGFVQRGVVLDAVVSKELLQTIFIPAQANFLHDGAVIIRSGRIWKAGVILPLSGNPSIDKAFGTRHQAALGLSEETDAVVVVVSEERKEVSVCFNGNIATALDEFSLRKVLHELLHVRSSRAGAQPVPKEGDAHASPHPKRNVRSEVEPMGGQLLSGEGHSER